MIVKISELNRAQREEMFNLHATYVNPEATEKEFSLLTVPVKTIDLTAIPKDQLYSMDKDTVIMYMDLIGSKSTKYPVISGTALIDGLHRITAGKLSGQKTMEVLDFGSLLKPEESGMQFEVKVMDVQEAKPKMKH